jgi:hypothetical protein
MATASPREAAIAASAPVVSTSDAQTMHPRFDVGQWFTKQEVIDLVDGEASDSSIEKTLKDMQVRRMIINNDQKTKKLRYAKIERRRQ